jgi:hypothetical protein
MKLQLWFGATLLLFATTGFAQKPVVVGICPFDDDTGTDAGEKAGTMLPVMFLDKAKAAGIVPVIVNPGPDTTPGDLRWPVDVARMVGADAVIVGQVRALVTSKGAKPNDATLRGHVLLQSHAATLVLRATMVDVSTGRELTAITAEEPVKGAWFTEAAAKFTPIGAAIHRDSFWFADTHFGQAITRAAEKLIAGFASTSAQVTPGGSYSTPPGGVSCPVTIGVAYKSKQRSSKMYLVAVNGKEESMGIKDGLLQVSEPSGPILLHVTVKDPPYRQPVQSTYYANSMLDCSHGDTTLTFEIGGSGEGVIRWR